MNFRFEKLIPLPMVELNLEGSEIWEADSFLFEAGRKYHVVAPSGKGKTSLLSVMYGLRKDYRGRLYIDDEDASSMGSRAWSELRKQKVACIFQGLELFDDLTAIENIRLKNNITKHKSEAEVRSIADRLGIGTFLMKKCGNLSFGQRQRVAITRALCQPFEMLLADECFSHIDAANSNTALQLLMEECDSRKAGLVLTSLDRNELEGFDAQVTL